MLYCVNVLDVYQKDRLGLYPRTYRVTAETPEHAKSLIIESIIQASIERDDLDVIEFDDVVLVYGKENDVLSDAFFITRIEPAKHQF